MLTLGMLFLVGLNDIYAQEVQIKRSHAISTHNPITNSVPTTGTLNVVAIMVEFQPDTNRLTSGTGVFGTTGMDGLPYLLREENTRVDPLPHNRDYFEAHLEFTKNYYSRSSDSQLDINYQVLPDVYQLDKKMEEYSPIGETFTLEKIAALIQDSWQAVEDAGGFDATGLDPENTAFVIFHAGIGRDVELTGTSLDITPFDIPSLYLKKSDLQELLNNPAFDGFDINGGTFRVTNSMIIPRTESRRGEDIQENEIVFPLSINGLLTASIGSHLGLPDLFNVETGEPAIGRFGLMDGAGFFAYNGLLPPEPSAWEKVFLGWETPFEITEQTSGDILLPATSLNQPNSIAKYSLSSSEYFLIENRHRDPENDGVIITTRKSDGTEVQQVFTNNDEDFVFQLAGFDTLLEAGTIIDVDNFDWSLPGGLDIGLDEEEGTDDDRFLNGGILIWHIDEALIQEELENSLPAVNTNENRKGIDLEEADGAQDIGRDPGLLDNSPSFGFAFDFWWAGNNYRVITATGSIDLNPDNIFGPGSFPNTNSNSGAKSFFELYDFSENLPTASFKIRSVSSADFGFEPLFSLIADFPDLNTPQNEYWDLYPLSIGFKENTSDTLLVIPGSGNVYIFDHKNPELAEAITFSTTSSQQPLLRDLFILGSNPSLSSQNPPEVDLNSFDFDAMGDTIRVWDVTAPANKSFLTTSTGDSLHLDFANTSILISDGSEVVTNSSFDFRSEMVNSNSIGISGNTANFTGESISNYSIGSSNRTFGGLIKTNSSVLYYILGDSEFILIDPSNDDPFTTIFSEENAEWPAIVDEAYIYRINKTESSIEGYNRTGALLDNMPIHAPDEIQFIGTPLIADITGDNIQDIIVVGQDDYSVNIYAYETTGDLISGFPLYVGNAINKTTQPIHPSFYEDVLYAVSHTGDLKAWKLNNFTSSQWPSRYGNNPFNKVSGDIQLSNSNPVEFSVLNENETYNWPNPANELTNIRYEVEAPGGTVEVTIIDYSGRIVFEQTVQANGGTAEEIQVTTRDWASGAYFAMIKATVEGKSESKLIKIGVTH